MICAVCRRSFFARDMAAFLCPQHEQCAPPELMQDYRDAVNACTRYRKAQDGYVDPVDMPDELADEAVAAFYRVRDAAIREYER